MKKSGSILIVILALLLLGGCSSMTKVDEDAVKDVSGKITKAIINTVGKEKAQKQESHSMVAENFDTLKIKGSVGDIDIKSGESKEATIDVNIIAQSDSKKNAEKLIEEYSYTIDENMNSIDIDTTISSHKIFNTSNLKVKLSITVPENINNIIISSNVGDIKITDIKGIYDVKVNVGDMTIMNSAGSYNLYTNVGDISLSDSLISGNSEISTNTGDIKATFKDMSDSESLKATTDVGDIDITVPENSSYEAVINEFMEKERTETNGDKHTKIKLKTGVGNIDFN